jgi:tetratricopeptide (TPR) repeat protein
MLRSLLGAWLSPREHPGDRAAESECTHAAPASACPPERLAALRSRLAAQNADAALLDEARALAGDFPDCIEARCLFGEAALRNTQAQLALAQFDAVLEREPQRIPALLGQGRAYLALGRKEDAADSFELVLAMEAEQAQAHLELGALYQDAGSPERAVGHFEAAARHEASNAEAWHRLALAKQALARAADAAAAFERALALEPKDPAIHINFGVFQLDCLGDPAAAEACFRRALALGAHEDAAKANLGLALQEQGHFEAALAIYANAEKVSSNPEFRWNRALANLGRGRFAAGWHEYETRFEREGTRARRSFPFAAWRGELPANGRLLVYAEQGLGDEIMFASCVPDLVRAGARVVLECDPRLESIFGRSFPQVEVRGVKRDGRRDWLLEFPDLVSQVPIGSLPRFFRNRLQDFPDRTSYLQADPARIDRSRRALPCGKPLVGLTWRGGTVKTRTLVRSLELQTLRALLALDCVTIVCLQHDLREEEAALLRQSGAVVPQELHDLDRTAALIAALDGVVAVPNTTAHLAGALGAPLWVLVSACPEWRWQQANGARMPWYPHATLLRQSRAFEWSEVLVRVIEAMRNLAAGTCASTAR